MYNQRFKSEEERFAEKYTVEPNGCWIWNTGPRAEYPKFWTGYGYERANRYVWRKTNGPPEPGKEICHTCDTPACVNPEHLFIGTHSDNMIDRSAKGRLPSRKGELNQRAKLSQKDVEVIRARYAQGGISQQALANEYGIGQVTVSHLIRGKTWNSTADLPLGRSEAPRFRTDN
jgi:predicted XRE-type DNA-binding protein